MKFKNSLFFKHFPSFVTLSEIWKLADMAKHIESAYWNHCIHVNYVPFFLLSIIFLQTTCLISLIWKYRHVELMNLNPDWLWPIASVIAFPTGIPGAVGITCWVLICNVILRRLAQLKSTWESSKLHQSWWLLYFTHYLTLQTLTATLVASESGHHVTEFITS